MKPLLVMNKITRDFPGVRALDRVDFTVSEGEVHGLVGENGAGKSTLIKILNGVIQKDSGEIYFSQEKVEITNPHQAQLLGISTIYQEPNSVPELSIGENIFLGREPKHKYRFLNYPLLYKEAGRVLKLIGSSLNPRQLVGEINLAEQQMVEIAKALSYDARLIVMDEPSAVLTQRELKKLFAVILSLKAKGKSIIYISHRLEEIFEIADRVTVLRDGKFIKTLLVRQTNKKTLVELMVGRKMEEEFPSRKPSIGEPVVRVNKLNTLEKLKDISFRLNKGEILGIFGLVGAGRTELARAIFGADPLSSGDIYLQGEKINIRSPNGAIQKGIALATEDRKNQGLLLEMSVKANITLASMPRITRMGFIKHGQEKELTAGFIRRMKIKLSSPEEEVLNLSGGNQQKVVLARWLCSKATILILDEPTRGVDVGAKREVYLLMQELAKQGMAILMISSELPEILAISDRILVMHEGEITGEFLPAEATPEKIMYCATGTGN